MILAARVVPARIDNRLDIGMPLVVYANWRMLIIRRRWTGSSLSWQAWCKAPALASCCRHNARPLRWTIQRLGSTTNLAMSHRLANSDRLQAHIIGTFAGF